MKIAHVITRWLKAGSEENTLATCMYQVEQGHDVYLVYGREFDREYLATLPAEIKPVQVCEMVHEISPLQDAKAVIALRRLYIEHNFDVVHTHQSKAGIVGRIARCGLRNLTVVHTVHIAPFLNVKGPKKIIFTSLERVAALMTHKIINVSNGMMEACLVEKIGRQDQHVVIRSGMPLSRFKSATPPSDWRREIGGWDGTERPKLIVMVAAFEPRKRQEQLIEAIAPYFQDAPDVCLLFVGQGARLEAARKLADELGITKNVRFRGYTPNPEVYIALADVCILTSEREGLPRVLVQYIAAGKPTVAMNLPSIEEVISHNYNGLILAADDFQAFVRTVLSLCRAPTEMERLGLGAKATDVSAWALEAMGMQIDQVYASVQREAA